MTVDLVCSWATLYRRLLLELLRLLKPVLLWVLRVLLVRLILMLLMMYLGTQGVPGAAPVGHPFAGRDFIVKATLLSASGAAPICLPSGARTVANSLSPIAT
ncbi:zona occludens toxin [Pseudomonas aeruginosa]|nr:hypothetical protein [Pseudomonas aeruginosa]SUC99493.1 zona occludens toxin [Pseudomonas aeruginosa]